MDAITQQMSSCSLQPDAQVWFNDALRASAEIRQASSTEEKQRLTQAMARKATDAPADMAKVFVKAFASVCDIKNSFECSGRQPTKEEADRNEAALGYRTPTAFLNAVAGETGMSIRTLRRCLDATHYYHWELTLPKDKPMNPCVEAACIMWDLVQSVEPEQRLKIMAIAQHEANAQKEGKLTKPAAAAVQKKALGYLKPQVAVVEDVTEEADQQLF